MFGWAVDAFNTLTGRDIANKNYNLEKNNLEYQKWLQGEIFKREDNAVQRRAMDLKAAGLSQTLAAGGAASAGAIVPTKAPQMENRADSSMQALSIALDIARSRADISKTMADKAVSEATANKIGLDNMFQKDTYNDRVMMASAALNETNAKIANEKLDQVIKQNNISLFEIEKAKQQISVDAARLGMDETKQNIAAKQIAVQNAMYNQEWYKNHGLPQDMSLGGTWQGALLGENLGREIGKTKEGIFDKIGDFFHLTTPDEVQKSAQNRGVNNSRGGAR